MFQLAAGPDAMTLTPCVGEITVEAQRSPALQINEESHHETYNVDRYDSVGVCGTLQDRMANRICASVSPVGTSQAVGFGYLFTPSHGLTRLVNGKKS